MTTTRAGHAAQQQLEFRHIIEHVLDDVEEAEEYLASINCNSVPQLMQATRQMLKGATRKAQDGTDIPIDDVTFTYLWGLQKFIAFKDSLPDPDTKIQGQYLTIQRNEFISFLNAVIDPDTEDVNDKQWAYLKSAAVSAFEEKKRAANPTVFGNNPSTATPLNTFALPTQQQLEFRHLIDNVLDEVEDMEEYLKSLNVNEVGALMALSKATIWTATRKEQDGTDTPIDDVAFQYIWGFKKFIVYKDSHPDPAHHVNGNYQAIQRNEFLLFLNAVYDNDTEDFHPLHLKNAYRNYFNDLNDSDKENFEEGFELFLERLQNMDKLINAQSQCVGVKEILSNQCVNGATPQQACVDIQNIACKSSESKTQVTKLLTEIEEFSWKTTKPTGGACSDMTSVNVKLIGHNNVPSMDDAKLSEVPNNEDVTDSGPLLADVCWDYPAQTDSELIIFELSDAAQPEAHNDLGIDTIFDGEVTREFVNTISDGKVEVVTQDGELVHVVTVTKEDGEDENSSEIKDSSKPSFLPTDATHPGAHKVVTVDRTEAVGGEPSNSYPDPEEVWNREGIGVPNTVPHSHLYITACHDDVHCTMAHMDDTQVTDLGIDTIFDGEVTREFVNTISDGEVDTVIQEVVTQDGEQVHVVTIKKKDGEDENSSEIKDSSKPQFVPTDLIGRKGGQCHRAKIVDVMNAIEKHQLDFSKDKEATKFKVSLDNDQYEDTLTFSAVIGHLEKPNSLGSQWNTMTQSESAENREVPLITATPVEPVSCTLHAKPQLDRQDGNRLWQEAIDLELDSLHEHSTAKDHPMFDVKHDGRLKARLVAHGNLTDTPMGSVHSGIVSLCGLEGIKDTYERPFTVLVLQKNHSPLNRGDHTKMENGNILNEIDTQIFQSPIGSLKWNSFDIGW
jgi:hypothetical protein